MRVAVKPVITTSIALVGASVIAVTPIEPPAAAIRAVESDVSLSASSAAYVPINMIQQALSAPANMVAAMDRLAAAMVISGSWNENHANNQWGWDEANPAMLKELVNVLIPFPAFSEPYGRHLNWWATANLPMYEGCNFDCPDLPGMLERMFKVPMSEFYSDEGYTFPVVRTPFNGEETPWSEENVKLDPAEPIKSVWDSLTAEPTGVKTTTMWEVVTAVANLSAAMQITGHMPDWIAVREIETFVKLFLRPPAEEATAPTDADAPADPVADSVSELTRVSDPVVTQSRSLLRVVPQAGDEPARAKAGDVTDAGGADADAAKNDTGGVVDAPEKPAAESIVDTATNVLKGKFALAPRDTGDAGADATDEAGKDAKGAKDVTDANDATTTKAPSGKHRKGDGSTSTATSTAGSESSGSGSTTASTSGTTSGKTASSATDSSKTSGSGGSGGSGSSGSSGSSGE